MATAKATTAKPSGVKGRSAAEAKSERKQDSRLDKLEAIVIALANGQTSSAYDLAQEYAK